MQTGEFSCGKEEMGTRVHDPLFHYETHFPERLSRLHLTPDLGPQSPQRRNRRTRSSRQDVRYKTQPVTFDEIQEVDEENIHDENAAEEIKSMQAFSRSMDGLLPKVGTKAGKKAPKNAESRLTETAEDKENVDRPVSEKQTNTNVSGLPPTGLSRDPRRQRMTAKAKRRQMMAEAREGE